MLVVNIRKSRYNPYMLHNYISLISGMTYQKERDLFTPLCVMKKLPEY